MNLNVESWKEFRLGDLFSEIYKAEAHVKGELECYNVPSDNTIRFISRTEMNNGCDCYVLNNDLSGIEKANAIAIGDTTATCFYQGEDFVCGDHMVICRADWLNLYTALFLISILKQEKYKYSFFYEFDVMKYIPKILNNMALDSGNKITTSVPLGHLGTLDTMFSPQRFVEQIMSFEYLFDKLEHKKAQDSSFSLKKELIYAFNLFPELLTGTNKSAEIISDDNCLTCRSSANWCIVPFDFA